MPPRRFQLAAASLALLALAALLRFPGLNERGLAFTDEGFNVLEGRYVVGAGAELLKLLWRCGPARLAGSACETDVAAAMDRAGSAHAGYFPIQAKLTHALLIGLAQSVPGWEVTGGNWVAAFLGAGTVPVLIATGLIAFRSWTAALAAGALLAASGYHAMYSRQSLAEADSVFFFSVAMLCYCLAGAGGKRRWIFLAGAFAGLSFTANSRWVIIPPLMLGLEGIRALLAAPFRFADAGARLGLLLAGLALAPLAWQFVTLLPGWLNPGGGLDETYFAVLFDKQWNDTRRAIYALRLDHAWTYVLLLWSLHGPLSTLLAASGIAASLAALVAPGDARRRLAAATLAAWCLAPMLYSANPFVFARNYSLALPALALAGGYGLSGLVEAARRWALQAAGRPWFPAAAICLVTLAAMMTALPALDTRNSFQQTMDFLSDRGAGRHVSTQVWLSRAYFSSTDPVGVSKETTPAELRKLALEDGFRYMLVDFQKYGGGPEQVGSTGQGLAQVEASCPPLWEAPSASGLYPFQFVFEHGPNWQRGQAFLASLNDSERLAPARVYDLMACLPAQ